ncbi:MAG: glutathione S-transferase [gamma proteobacterium symbiont of Ctena orbiculata]|uniref:Glutathione S-transferase family protein n=1 Tax=Candidatus Thiodiazotropha taylori TaxID=2792791 RepID=A0A944QU46_9GAMM|nr:glutathione S-transferase family protein [Candidatus Thiodiazotropha taylori]PUB88568.1 MAG: glutathione S-transferase [gamma proteobacterium symbiont of Ctena orbiculata]MBT2989747.1 glutathione S-transferase family protein [Candidatus Thiodiazotropha taylori]MBT2995914.1 glutathione S-transferase family protein [Candidatus Thiodiazotropha taylori]MBT2999229.1 glutathione S-transferase family protein [Candidatus Thiodiazotropha taylori]
MADLKLYNFPRSGNCYKVRLLLSMLGLDYERVDLDLIKGESLTEAFKRINPRGQVPVLVDGDLVIWDSMAILVYLARRYAASDWLPTDPLGETRVMQWLAVSENELLYGLARARAALVFGKPFDLKLCQQDGRAGLSVLELKLSESDWLAADNVSIADIACYPYVSLAAEGEVSLQPYPAVCAWLGRVEGLPDWVPFLPG